MFICIINNVDEDKFKGVIGFDNDNIGYLSNDEELNEILDKITDYKNLNIEIEEQINNQTLILNKKVSTKDNLYLVGLIEHIKYPYKVVLYKELDGELKDILIKEFNDNNEVIL